MSPKCRLPSVSGKAHEWGGHLQLKYAWGGFATYQPGETFGPRVLGDYELVWIITGSAVYQHDGKSINLSAGAVLLTRPGFDEKYQWDEKQRTRHAYVHFTPEVLPSDWGKPDTWPIVREGPLPGAMAGLFHHVLSHWANRAETRRKLPPRWVNSALETMIDMFLHPTTDTPKTQAMLPSSIQRTLQWAEQTLTDSPQASIRLEQLAKAGSVSAKHLCRLFDKHLQMTPMQAVRLLRLEQALGFLQRSNLSMKQIADRCGFASPYHFSRVFHQVYGLPPTEARREMMLGAPPPSAKVALGGWQAREMGV